MITFIIFWLVNIIISMFGYFLAKVTGYDLESWEIPFMCMPIANISFICVIIDEWWK